MNPGAASTGGRCALLASLTLWAAWPATALPQTAPRAAASAQTVAAVLRPLKPGLMVSMRLQSGAWELSILNDGQVGTHSVIELGPSHVVLQDLASVTRIWIPVTAILAVTWTRTTSGPESAKVPRIAPIDGPWTGSPLPGP